MFTSTTEVVQPPPRAKCGITVAVLEGVWLRSATGRLVTKNSERSFVCPRTAIAESGTVESNVNVPSMAFGNPFGAASAKTGSFRNAEI